MAEGAGDPYTTAEERDALVAAELKISDELGLVPLCLRSVIPEEMRCSIIGDHVLYIDGEGNNWMTISAHQSFSNACHKLHAERRLPQGTTLWVVVMPHMPLQDARDLKSLIQRTGMLRNSKGSLISDNQSGGWCRGVPFVVKNMILLESKVQEHMNFSGISGQIMSMASHLNDNLCAIRDDPRYQGYISESFLQQQNELCAQFKEHLVLSMYWREICDDSDVVERFGPHAVIHKLLPELHYSIYGHGNYDPCDSTSNNSEHQMQATEERLKEEIGNLMLKNESYKKAVSVDKRALSFIHAKGEEEKLLKLTEVLKRLDQSLQIFQAEVNSICLDLDKLCVQPSLVGNTETVPDWVLVEDHDEADFDEEGSSTPDWYPESSSDD